MADNRAEQAPAETASPETFFGPSLRDLVLERKTAKLLI
jgi:hypothetical protein